MIYVTNFKITPCHIAQLFNIFQSTKPKYVTQITAKIDFYILKNKKL